MHFHQYIYYIYVFVKVTVYVISSTPTFKKYRVLFTTVPFKGSDWQCLEVELSMQCCGKLLSESFETY